MRLKIIDRYTIGKIWPPAVLAAGVISFVVVGGAVRTEMRELLERMPITQIAVFDIVRIALYALPTLVGYIFPVTFLMAIMFVFSQLAQRSELIALKAAGIPLKRISLPIILFGLFLSGLAFVISDQCQPWAYWRLMRLLVNEMPLRMSVEMLPTGAMHKVGEWRIYLGRRDADGTLRDIVILQPEEDRANAFYAESAHIRQIDGKTHLELKNGYFIPSDPRQHFRFDSLLKAAPQPEAMDIPSAYEGMTTRRLLEEEQRVAIQYAETEALPVGIELHNLRLEIKNRLAFPLMCLAVSIVGAPVGARARRTGHSYAFTIGLAIISSYFILRKLVELPILLSLPATVALGQIPNGILVLLGLVLLWRVDRV